MRRIDRSLFPHRPRTLSAGFALLQEADGGSFGPGGKPNRLQCLRVDDHERLTGGVMRYRPFGAQFAPEQSSKTEASGPQRLRHSKLEQLSAEHRQVGTSGERVVVAARQP